MWPPPPPVAAVFAMLAPSLVFVEGPPVLAMLAPSEVFVLGPPLLKARLRSAAPDIFHPPLVWLAQTVFPAGVFAPSEPPLGPPVLLPAAW